MEEQYAVDGYLPRRLVRDEYNFEIPYTEGTMVATGLIQRAEIEFNNNIFVKRACMYAGADELARIYSVTTSLKKEFQEFRDRVAQEDERQKKQASDAYAIRLEMADQSIITRNRVALEMKKVARNKQIRQEYFNAGEAVLLLREKLKTLSVFDMKNKKDIQNKIEEFRSKIKRMEENEPVIREQNKKWEKLGASVKDANCVTWGTWEGEAIDWYIIKVDDNRVQLFSSITWNTIFHPSASPQWNVLDALRLGLGQRNLSAVGYGKYGLLSIDEFKQLPLSFRKNSKHNIWWLQEAGKTVDPDGELVKETGSVYQKIGFRPAIWVDLDKV